MTRLMSCAVALMLLVAAAPAAAQLTTNERDILNREHSGNLSLEERGRLDGIKASQAAQDAKHAAAAAAQRERLLRLPPLPDERNVLLGSWRLEDGGLNGALSRLDQRRAAGGTDSMFRDLWATLESNPAKLLCGAEIGNGITFASTTYSIQALDGSKYAGSIAYRSPQNQVIVALPANWKDMAFRVAGPNRILFRGECALVRVGAPPANAAANTTKAPSTARTAAASGGPGAVVDGAAFRCADGGLLHVSLCQGDAAEANCKLAELHLPGLQMGKMARRTDIAARVAGCEAGGIRYGADDKPVFVR
jgi:hypothetical protein